MIISREVDINVNRYGLRVVIPVVQYDSGRQIIFNIVDAELPSGCTSNIFIRKPSGKSVYNSCTVSGNKVTVTLTNQSLSEYGFNDAQIQIIKGEEVVTSFSFILEVKRSDADNAVISRSESSFFQGMVSKAQAAAKTCTDVLNSIPDDYSQLSTDVKALNSRSYRQISTNYASGCYTYKRGNVGFLKISDPKNLEANKTTVIGNLPAGFRPDVAYSFYLPIRNMTSGTGVTINPNGDINVYNYSSNTGTLNINETITYPLA